MISLPHKIEAQGFGCLIASVIMVCMYWRQKEPFLMWTIDDDFSGTNWKKILTKGMNYIKSGGIPFNLINRFLSNLDFPLNARLEYLADISQLNKLLSFKIPPIILYDRYFLLRGIKQEPYHAVPIVDKTQETFTAVDPSLSPKFFNSLLIQDIVSAWAQTRNATIIISPKRIKLRREKKPSTTLERWLLSK
jgi:hypothetical protein